MRTFAVAAMLMCAAASAAPGGGEQDRYALGLKLRNGAGVPVNAASAYVLVKQAAEGGHAPAMFTLSNMLAHGEGTPADRQAAQRWLRAAAERDYPEALQQLAMEESDSAKASQLMRAAGHALKHRKSDHARGHSHSH